MKLFIGNDEVGSLNAEFGNFNLEVEMWKLEMLNSMAQSIYAEDRDFRYRPDR